MFPSKVIIKHFKNNLCEVHYIYRKCIYILGILCYAEFIENLKLF